ncbi:glycosyltransferase related enzyme [Mycoplasma sp. CAG:611]|nr:glycosyltransferase related enzyme [Mycoplasma sp. CAG:611]
MKIYILMPTYNDSSTIVYSLDSILSQNYKNYEIIIVDDGSTDDTKKVINNYKKKYDKDNKIKYIYQENKDQLNALKTACNYIKEKNSLVYILHSDDLLDNPDVLKKAINYMKNNNYDAIISNVDTIDGNGNLSGKIKINKYINKKYIMPLQLLWLGRNLYIDFGFFRTNIFLNQVYNNYLTWNGPFWLDLDSKSILNVKNVDFNFFKYRVFEENYINNDLGKLCVINGEIRVVTRLLNYYYIPFYKVQFYMYRLFNKIKINKLFKPFYFNKEAKNKKEVIKFFLRKRFTDIEITNNLYLNAIDNFYSKNTSRTIVIDEIPDDLPIYLGSDLRTFNKKIIENKLEEFYVNFLNEMQIGFDKIIINEKYKEKITNIVKFLSIYGSVEIVFKK